MNWVERIARWVGLDVSQERRPEIVNLRATLEAIRNAKRSENYPEALEAIARAEGLVRQIGGAEANNVQGLLALHRADITMRRREFDDADRLLGDIVRASPAGQSYQRAYAMVMLGVLAYQQGDWEVARERLEHARDEAVAAKSLGAEGRAICHLADLYMDEGNEAYAVHLQHDGLDKLNRSGDIEMAAYFVGRMAEAERGAGNDDNADTLLSRALRLAQQTHSRPDLRKLHTLLSRRALALDRRAEAYQHAQSALQQTDPTSHDRQAVLTQAARAAIAVDHVEEGEGFIREALALTPNDPSLSAVLGLALFSAGQPEAAIDALEQADKGGKADPETQRLLAMAYYEAGQAERAEQHYERLAATAQARGAQDEAAALLRDYGMMRALQARWPEAVKLWSDSLTLYRANGAPNPLIARLYCDIANARLALGQGERALRDFDQALMLVSRADDLMTRGLVLANAAAVYIEKGDVETAEAFFAESIQIAQKTNDITAEATRQGNYGWFQWVIGRYTRAQSALTYAIGLSERAGLTLQAAVQTSNLAQATTELGDPDEATRLHLRALAMLKPTDPNRWQAIVRTNAALHALRTGDLDDARTWLADAAAFVPLTLDAEAHYRVQIAAALAERDDTPSEGVEHLQSVLPAIRATGLKRLLADALSALSQLCVAAQQPEAARAHWDEAHKLYRILSSPAAQTPPIGLLAQP